MAVYAVSFRFEEDASGDERRRDFVGYVRREAAALWEDTTSFLVVRTGVPIDRFSVQLIAETRFDPAKDLLLVVDISDAKFARIGGKIKDGDFARLIPGVRQL
ncbi:hypothetical protein [Bradyrhizobium sp. USDA 4452]